MRSIITVAAILLASLRLSAQSFQQQSIALNKSISDVSMVNTSVGYAGGVDGIYKTVNGGQNWDLLPFFIITGDVYKDYIVANFNVLHLHFFNELEGFAYGWHSFNAEIIMATTDGGATWTVKHYEIPEGVNYDFNYLNSLHVFNPSSMVIVGSSGRILRTTDGGEHWTGTRISDDEEPELSKIQFTSETEGYAAGDNRFYASSNAGIHWSLRKLNFHLNDFHFFDTQNGIAIGNHGSFFETSDGGKTWTQSLMRSEFSLNHLTFVNNLIGYATGTSGLIYKTTDGGKSWIKIYSDGNEISSASLLSPDIIWFSVQKGYLLHSTNGGFIPVNAPSLSSASPNSAKIGSSITLTGTNFNSVVGVKFNGVPASFQLLDGSIVTEVPRGASTGKIELVWPNGFVFSAFDFVISQEPKLYSPSPNATTVGSTTIIQGENLQYTTQVTLDDFTVEYVILNSKEISVRIPSDFNYYRLAALVVSSPFGSASMELRLVGLPEVTNMANRVAPGTLVTITGFDLFLASEVTFGDVPAASFEVVSNTEIKCVVPDVEEKLVAPIHVITPGGKGSSVGDFSIFPGPVITSVTPSVVKVGEEIKIEGKNLPTDKWFGSVKIEGREIHSLNIRHDDDHTIYVKMQSITGGDQVEVTVTNEVYLKTTKTFPFTITGRLPYTIESVSPLKTTGSPGIFVRGFFPHVDSLTVNGLKQNVSQAFENILTFIPNENTTSGMVTIFVGGEAISYPEELIIADASAPTISDFNPKIASVGTKITFQAHNIRYINSIQVNEQYVPFDPAFSMGYISELSFTVSDSITSGPITITTIDGVFKTAEKLIIKPANEVKPIISRSIYANGSDGYIMKLIGHNFSNTTGVRLDQFRTGFIIQHDDTLLVKIPENISSLYLSTYQVIVESPFGQADYWADRVSYPTQTIVSVTPSFAKRGSILTVKLTPKIPYVRYNDDINTHFYFGNTNTQKYIKVDETTYLLEVPKEGQVEGKIGISSAGFTFYSDVNFKLAGNDYCTAVGGGQQTFPIKKLMIQGNRVAIGTDGYIDNTNTPITVIPGQPLRIGITPSQIGVMSKIFIDWNGDKEFNEPGIIMSDGNALAPQDTMTYVIVNVPPSATTGTNIRLRIVSRLYNSDDLLACGIRYLGQVLDYQLNVEAPTNTLKIFDFYPEVGKANTFVTVTGDHLNALQSVTLNGLPLNFSSASPHTIDIMIPEGAANGKLVFQTATESVTTSRTFVIDTTIAPPGNNNLKYIYRATIDGKDVAFFTVINPGWENAELHTVQEFPENGTLCVYTPGGQYCYPDRILFRSEINFPLPFIVKANETVTLTGRNLSTISRILLDNAIEIPFTINDEHSFSFVPPSPPSNAIIHTITILDKWAGIEKEITYYTPEPTCDPNTGWMEGSEMINVKFNQISNSSGKNTTGGRSDYSDKVAIVDLYNSYYTDVAVKNFSTERKFISISVIVNGTDTLGRYFSNYVVGASAGIYLEPNEESILHPYIAIPKNIPLNKPIGCWFVLEYYSWDNYCESRIGEIEKYTIHAKQNPVNPMLTISSISQTTTRINEEIIITGTGLDQVKSLQIGELYVPFTINTPSSGGRVRSPIEIASISTIRFTVPPEASSGKITITSLNDDVQYPTPLKIIQPHTITSIEPPYGKPGDAILLHGTNFTNVTTILFNGIEVDNFLLYSANTIRVIVPFAGKSGPIQLKNEFDQQVNSETFYICDGTGSNPYCKVDQSITFADLNSVRFGQSPFALTAITSSSLPVSYISSNTSVATISGNMVTIVGSGTSTITARQSGNNIYNAASDVTRSLVVSKSLQSITFPVVSEVNFSELPVTLLASSSSGLKVTFSSGNEVTILDNVLTSPAPGKVTIRASQIGNNNYEPASPVDRSFCILPLKPVITLTETTSNTYTLFSSSTTNNHWFYNDEEIQGANNTSLSVTEAGSYKVRVVTNDCTSPFSEEIAIIITDIENGKGNILIYPNPIKSKMTIQSAINFSEVVITNMISQEIKRIHVSSFDKAMDIDLSDLKSGLMILELYTKDKLVYREKFIKE